MPLRAGARDGYLRITIGWPETVNYTVARENPETLIIIFDKAASLDSSEVDFSKLENISALQIISSDPLKVSLKVPAKSDIRDFKIGKRIILDVYDPPASAPQAETKTPEQPKPKSQPEEKAASVETKLEEKSEKPKEVEKSKESAPPAKPPAFVLVPEQLNKPVQSEVKKEQEEAESESEKTLAEKAARMEILEQAVQEDRHIISLRSTNSLPLAVFESYDNLWLVMKDRSGVNKPGLSSPTPDIFDAFRVSSAEDDIRIFQTNFPNPDFNIKVTEGGLIWNIVISDKISPGEPQKAERFKDAVNKVVWRLGSALDVVDVPDPVTGETLKVVMVEDSADFAGGAQSFVDFDVLNSPMGLVIRPKVDDLQVLRTEDGIEIFRESGLNISSQTDIREAQLYNQRLEQQQVTANESGSADDTQKEIFFRFNEWRLGDFSEVEENERVLLSSMREKSDARRVEDILTLGKMFLSHGLGAEALGYFHLAEDELPELEGSAEFKALRGVSKALDWQSDAALRDFLDPQLDEEKEVKYWKSYVLADLGDWRQAVSVLPPTYKPIYEYPDPISTRLSLVLAEVNLRDGRVDAAQELMDMAAKHEDKMIEPMKAYLQYLRGEAFRQKKEKAKTKELWEPLTKGNDDLHRTKAGLAMTILLLNESEINNENAIDRLERLRYSWRGDDLEAQVNFWLGKSYFEEENFIKGLSIMRDAVAIAGTTDLGQRITKEMTDTFTNLYLGGKLDEISAIDAVAIYDQFSELTPVGDDGDKVIQRLAERLIDADLIPRAAKLLSHQVEHRLEGEEKMRIAIRLAVVQLVDEKPQQAIDALAQAEEIVKTLPEERRTGKEREIQLLKVQSYLQNKEYDRALGFLDRLEPGPDTNRLRADVTWQAGYWDDAAIALDEVIIDEDISLTRPLTQEQASLLLNRAIALNLSNDRVALSNMREKYSDLMLQTHKANQFEVITRPRNNTTLADRDTMMSIVSEVELFKDFLDSYRASSSPVTQ